MQFPRERVEVTIFILERRWFLFLSGLGSWLSCLCGPTLRQSLQSGGPCDTINGMLSRTRLRTAHSGGRCVHAHGVPCLGITLFFRSLGIIMFYTDFYSPRCSACLVLKVFSNSAKVFWVKGRLPIRREDSLHNSSTQPYMDLKSILSLCAIRCEFAAIPSFWRAAAFALKNIPSISS